MRRLFIGGLLLLLLAIAVQFPAECLAPIVARATGERWRLAAIEGTVWRGHAIPYAFDRTSGAWQAGPAVKWRVLWRKLTNGVMAAQLDFDNGGHAELTGSARGWVLESVDATIPAALLTVLLPSTIADYGWSGTFTGRTRSFGCNWGHRGCTGQADLTWHAAATRQIPGPPLGDYGVRITGEGDALRFAVGTIGGRLKASGAGEISPQGLQFTGEAAASGDDVRLDSLLRAIGRPSSPPGHYIIEYRETPAIR